MKRYLLLFLGCLVPSGNDPACQFPQPEKKHHFLVSGIYRRLAGGLLILCHSQHQAPVSGQLLIALHHLRNSGLYCVY